MTRKENHALFVANVILLVANAVLWITGGESRQWQGELQEARSYTRPVHDRPNLGGQGNWGRASFTKEEGREPVAVPAQLALAGLVLGSPDLLDDDVSLTDRTCSFLGIPDIHRAEVNERLIAAFESIQRNEVQLAKMEKVGVDEGTIVIGGGVNLRERANLARDLSNILGKEKADLLVSALEGDRFFRDEPEERSLWIQVQEGDEGEEFALMIQRSGESAEPFSGWISQSWARGEPQLLRGLLQGRYQHVIPEAESWEKYLHSKLSEPTPIADSEKNPSGDDGHADQPSPSRESSP